MKYAAVYSSEKFANFSYDAQLKALAKLLQELEKNIADAQFRAHALQQISTLLPLVKQEIPAKMQRLVQNIHTDPHRLLRALAEYHSDKLLKDDQILLRVGDGNIAADPAKLVQAAQITVLADNLRSVFNVGSLFRVCECLAIGELVLCGISPDPDHPNMQKTALGTCDRVKWHKEEHTEQAVRHLQQAGYRVYALETAEPSRTVFSAEFSYPMALVVGNEALGVNPAVLQLCDEIVHLPVLGWKNSLNVSVATSVALYQILYGGKHGHD